MKQEKAGSMSTCKNTCDIPCLYTVLLYYFIILLLLVLIFVQTLCAVATDNAISSRPVQIFAVSAVFTIVCVYNASIKILRCIDHNFIKLRGQ